MCEGKSFQYSSPCCDRKTFILFLCEKWLQKQDFCCFRIFKNCIILPTTAGGVISHNLKGPFDLKVINMKYFCSASLRWLLFSDPGFEGMVAVLDKGEYPFPETWGFDSPFVGSLRPLKMVNIKAQHHRLDKLKDARNYVGHRFGFTGSTCW